MEHSLCLATRKGTRIRPLVIARSSDVRLVFPTPQPVPKRFFTTPQAAITPGSARPPSIATPPATRTLPLALVRFSATRLVPTIQLTVTLHLPSTRPMPIQPSEPLHSKTTPPEVRPVEAATPKSGLTRQSVQVLSPATPRAAQIPP